MVALIEARRREVVASVLRSSSLTPHTVSMASSGFVAELLDGLRREFQEANRGILDRWIGSEAFAHGSCDHAALVRFTCDQLLSAYAGVHGACEPLARYLARRSEDLEAGLWSGLLEGDPGSRSETRDEVVASLLTTLQSRDAAICEHARVTGAWSGRLAKALGLSSHEQTLAVLSGLVHDVGKIATPSEILLKPESLTPDEWNDMKAHTLVGAKMLERLPSLRELAPAARSHHEHIDGKGYPDGLAGEEIPLMVRVVSVADSFHAMITNRPYRTANSIARALEILQEGSGTHWDAAVVDAMIHLVRPGRAGRPAQRRAEAGGF